MDQLKNINNNHSTSASSAIQSAIDDLSAIKTNKNASNTNTASNTGTALSSTAASASHQSTALSSIDSTLNALGDQYPFSEHRARPHSSNLSSATTQTAKNAELARTLGSFGTPGLNNLNNLNNPLSPSALTTHPAYNPLTHWGSVSSLRNPYPTYGAPRNATKASITNTKDSNNPRKKSYEDKMDKQRLEHILFSGDQSGPLNQQKERMRQKLQKKQANKQNKNKAKHKKTQSLPNTSSAAHGLLQLDAAKKQKANGDNGYFLTEINSKSSNKSTSNHTNNSNTNKKKKNRGNQRRGAKNQRQLKKKPKKQNQNAKNPKKKKKTQQKKKSNNTHSNQNNKGTENNREKSTTSTATTEGVVNHKLDECNQAFGEQSKQPNHKDYADQLPGDILNQQRDVFEQEPDEYFNDHDIAPLMQNKLKLELNQQISGISIWRDKKELEPLLNNGAYNSDYHKNENPNLLAPSQHTHNLTDDEEDDPFVDNFVNVGDSDNENEGGVAKNKISNLSSNSNDSESLEIFIDKNERELIDRDNRERDSEPGSVQNVNNEFQYEGINSNVDLIKYQESLRNNNNEDDDDRSRRNSTTLLDSSHTTQVDGGFDVNAEDEEKHIEAPKKAQLVFDPKAVQRPNEVQFVDEESDADRDIFENMQIKEAQTRTEREAEGAAKGEHFNALEKVLKAAGKKQQNGKQEEEREKETEDTRNKSGSNVGNIAATWVKIKNMSNQQQNAQGEGVKNDKNDNKKNEKKNDKKSDNKKNKKKKKNSNDGKQKKNKQQPKAEKKRKQKENKKTAKKQHKTNHVKDDAPAQKTEDGEITQVDKADKDKEKVDKEDKDKQKVEKKPSQTQNHKTKQSQNQNKKKDRDKSNEKKRKKRPKKKKNNKTKQKHGNDHTEKGEKNGEISHHKDGPRNVEKDNVSDDDTTTIDSSSNAPSTSTQDPHADDAHDNDGGWIIKGNKNKNNKNTKRNNRRESNRNNNNNQSAQINNVSSPRSNNKDVSTPMSSKSSNSRKSSFAYTDSMEVKPKDNKDKENKKKNKKHHKDSNKNKPQIKKSKSVSSTDNHHNNKSTNRLKNRKERRQNNRVNRQKSDPSLLKNNSKYPSSTIVVPSRHSKTIHTSMILPKSTHAATSDPLTKHNYPPLKTSHSKKVHFKDTNNVKRIGKVKQQPNINVNLSVLSSPTTPTSSTSKNECASTPHSDGGDHARHPRPTRPPITRLTNNPANSTPTNSAKRDSNNNTPPTPQTTLSNSQSEHLVDRKPQPQQQQQKPPLLTQRSAPLAGTSPLNTNNNAEINYNVSPANSNEDNNNNNNVLPPPVNNSLIASNGTNPTHMALYVDESGNLHETPLTLPDIFPGGLAPTSIPNVLGPLGAAVSLPTADADSNNNAESGDKQTQPTLPGLPVLGVAGLAPPPPQPSALGLTSFLPNLAGLPPLPGGVPNVPLPPLGGVAPLNAIPHTIPILLPMPQFTPEQMANLSKLNMVPKVPQAQAQNTPTKNTTLQPIVASFKPMKSKSKKLEQIKEHETMDGSTPNIEETQTKSDAMEREKESKEDNNNEHEKKEDKEERDTPEVKDEAKEFEEDEEKKEIQSDERRNRKKNKKIDDMSADDATMRTKDSSVSIIAHFTPKSEKECLETLKNDLIEDEKDDEWIEIADLDSTVYPATLWCLHVNKWSAHPQCSLKKLQQSMASALLSS